ncbi:MAG: site-specific integrase [Candidatus Accumulibacter sp.]|jgi:integrase|nr:site-specific integrase [Accumulibacter sp.]
MRGNYVSGSFATKSEAREWGAAKEAGIIATKHDQLPKSPWVALGYEAGQPARTKQQQVAVALLLSIETAMRPGEILGLAPEDIDLEKRFVVLPETKNGDRREVPLSRRVVELLESVMDGEAVFTVRSASADVLFRRARKAAGIDDVHFHDARSEALTRLSKKLDVLPLARMVGHRDPKSLMFYYNETASALAKRLD